MKPARNVAELLERLRFPIVIMDTTEVDWSALELRPGALVPIHPRSIRVARVREAVPWEPVRELLEEWEPAAL